jgi:hypothetical protein
MFVLAAKLMPKVHVVAIGAADEYHRPNLAAARARGTIMR